ncbi:cell division protein ZipA-like [Leguminivora glycinivorella]|uniref:cell division protein ZipA-like n=1 Tax=Leguminivora glycinivorella TaxID=1035111 RepID=UPI00200DA54B|nr:cell division protein ZipA-like [Leguminivora glycinivorella]
MASGKETSPGPSRRRKRDESYEDDDIDDNRSPERQRRRHSGHRSSRSRHRKSKKIKENVPLYVHKSVNVRGYTIVEVFTKPVYSGDLFIEPNEPSPPPQNLETEGLDERLGVSAGFSEEPPGPEQVPGPSSASLPVEPVPGPSSASFPVQPAPGPSSATEPAVFAEPAIAPEQLEVELIDPELLQILGDFVPEATEWGEEINDNLSKILTPILRDGLKKEIKEEILKNNLLPGPTAPLFSAQYKSAAEPQRWSASPPSPADIGAPPVTGPAASPILGAGADAHAHSALSPLHDSSRASRRR